MPVYFFDSSALVKRYRHEAGSDQVAQLLGESERVIVSRLAHVEVSAAIVRRARETQSAADEVDRVLNVLDGDLRDSLDVVEIDPQVMDHALSLTRKYALRAADAIQLACARLAVDPGEDLVFVSSDVALNNAAAAEGFHVVDPTNV